MTHPICPKCSAEYVVRVQREGAKELLLSIFYIYPFRCQLCGCRFRFLQWGVRYLTVYKHRREHERLPANFPAAFASDEVDGKGTVVDLSVNGCRIQTDTQLVEGNIVRMSLHIPDKLPPVTVDAAVVRNVQLDCAGLEFLKFQQTERERLQLFIRGEWLGERRRTDAIVDHAAAASSVGDHRLQRYRSKTAPPK